MKPGILFLFCKLNDFLGSGNRIQNASSLQEPKLMIINYISKNILQTVTQSWEKIFTEALRTLVGLKFRTSLYSPFFGMRTTCAKYILWS